MKKRTIFVSTSTKLLPTKYCTILYAKTMFWLGNRWGLLLHMKIRSYNKRKRQVSTNHHITQLSLTQLLWQPRQHPSPPLLHYRKEWRLSLWQICAHYQQFDSRLLSKRIMNVNYFHKKHPGIGVWQVLCGRCTSLQASSSDIFF